MTAFFTLFILMTVNNLFLLLEHIELIYLVILTRRFLLFLIVIFIIFAQLFIVYSGITIFGTTKINMKEIFVIFL
ncbi:MAG: hypothetical protein L6V91_08815 [Bacilli bacterium]|nr:MAG: hypothetical protein L6V91_08815 [Bacilli bacterium]